MVGGGQHVDVPRGRRRPGARRRAGSRPRTRWRRPSRARALIAAMSDRWPVAICTALKATSRVPPSTCRRRRRARARRCGTAPAERRSPCPPAGATGSGSSCTPARRSRRSDRVRPDRTGPRPVRPPTRPKRSAPRRRGRRRSAGPPPPGPRSAAAHPRVQSRPCAAHSSTIAVVGLRQPPAGEPDGRRVEVGQVRRGGEQAPRLGDVGSRPDGAGSELRALARGSCRGHRTLTRTTAAGGAGGG